MNAPVILFPPRGASTVLADALVAAMAAADRLVALSGPVLADTPRVLVEQAAMNAAAPILRGLTADPAMVEIVAAGMAAECMIRLHKRGLA